jgi:uncharacterized protein (TIGR02118 family)
MKLIALAQANEQVDARAFQRWLCGPGARELAESLGSPRCIVNVADQPSPWATVAETAADTAQPSYDALVELCVAASDTACCTATAAANTVRAQLELHCRSVHIYQVEETIWKRPDQPDRINLVALWNSPPGQPTAETQRHWREHAPLALAIHHGATGYVQNWVAKPVSADAPRYAGIAMLRFPSLEAIRDGLFRTEEDKATIAADVAEFVADNQVLYTTEHVILGSPP